MKRFLRLVVLAIVIGGCSLTGKAIKYVDATTLRIVNRGWTSSSPYIRLPNNLMSKFNSVAQGDSYCSSGLAIRYASNTRRTGVKYTLRTNTHMNHQAPTGTKGVALYILDNNVWRYCSTIRPEDKREQENSALITDMDGTWHEFMLYLPTYDGVTDLQITIDDSAEITSGNYDAIDVNKRVVLYGSSIMQGGCCSHPGLNATAIMSRMLNCEVINLGFSGGAKMEKTAAEAIGTIENVSAFIIDPIPNCTDEMCRDLTYDFVKTIRTAQPGVPIVMVEGHIYPYGRYSSYYQNYLPLKNKYFRENYEKLYAEDPTNLFYVTAEQLNPVVEEGTVEGIHYNDIGFMEYAKVLAPIVEPFCKGVDPMAITSPAHGAESTSLEPEFVWSHSQREGTLEIYSSAGFSASGKVFSGKGVGSVRVPKYVLAGGTHYYARVAYDGGNSNTVYTPVVEFTTQDVMATVPEFVIPGADRVLHSNENVKFTPIEGATSIRLEISSSNTFPARSSYISTISITDGWTDAKTGSEIKLGGAALAEGVTYYARANAKYMSGGNSSNTEWSPIVEFTYSNQAGVNSIEAEAPQIVKTESFDTAGRSVGKGNGVTLTRTTRTDGSVTVSKQVR